MDFKVYKIVTGEDVTDEREWYVDTDGNLLFMTNDVDCPLHEAGDEYCYRLGITIY